MKSNVMTLKKENYFPSQWEFLTNKKKISCYTGGFGSGKTHSLLARFFIALLQRRIKMVNQMG